MTYQSTHQSAQLAPLQALYDSSQITLPSNTVIIAVIVLVALGAAIRVSSGSSTSRRRGVYTLDREPTPGTFSEFAMVLVLVVLLVAAAQVIGVHF